MRQYRSSGSVEGVMGNHDSYSDSIRLRSDGIGHAGHLAHSSQSAFHARHVAAPRVSVTIIIRSKRPGIVRQCANAFTLR